MYDKKKQKAETYKSIEKRMKRIVLMYENGLLCRSFKSFLSHESFASFYDDCLHKWSMLWFFSASLKILKNYRIWFIIEERLYQAKHSLFSTNLETFSDTRDEKCIVEIWRKNPRKNLNLDEDLNTIDDIYFFNRSSRMFSLNSWSHLVKFHKGHSRNY